MIQRPKRGEPRKRELKFFEKLDEWIDQRTPTDLIVLLQEEGFIEMLSTQMEIEEKMMVAILKAFAKCCDCDSPIDLSKFVAKAIDCRFFFRLHVPEYLNSVEKSLIADNKRRANDESVQFTIDEKLSSIHALLVFMMKMRAMCPTLFADFAKTFSNITNMVGHINHSTKIRQESLDLFNELVVYIENVLKEPEKPEQVKEQPPDNFRELSLVPSHKDIHGEVQPFLRKNVVDKRYLDVDHYLDVHFRLMREDFIRPLREGITEYLKMKENRKRFRINGVFIYHNVSVHKVAFVEMGLIFKMKLDITLLPRIRWQSTKRLLPGSLLCLSWNSFKTFIFATVLSRKNQMMIEQGFFDILVDSTLYDHTYTRVLTENPGISLVVIEPLSYFEAYRHVLTSLQKLRPETFPFKRYFVELEKEIIPPEYLQPETTYDMTNFLQPLYSKSGKNDPPFVDLVDNDKSEENERKFRLEKVRILSDDCWPQANDMQLDDSQFLALKDALTKEVAIIQGPPGTGKTYIGLRIVQTLLLNSKTWDPNETNPILIACYTNHALDQFLEGILPFCNEIVRVGGRCKTESLKEFSLRELKRKHRFDFPFRLRKQIMECRKRLSCVQSIVNDNLQKIIIASKKLLPFEVSALIDVKLNVDQMRSLSTLNHRNFSENLRDWLGYNKLTTSETSEENVNRTDEEEADEMYDEEEINRIADDREDDLLDEEESTMMGFVENITVEEETLTQEQKMFKKHLKTQMANIDVMEMEKAKAITDVNNLSLEDRWRLYRLWVKIFVENYVSQNNKVIEEQNYWANVQRLQQLRCDEDLSVAKRAKIVGVTTTGAAKNRDLITLLKPKIVIIEEAAEVLESHVITSLTSDTKHLILIGDHIQLRPNPTVYELARNYALDVSLFERLVSNGLNYSKLRTQHRMHPRISEFLVPLFYKELEDHEIVKKYGSVKGVKENMFFIDHCEPEEVVNDSMSRFNLHETNFVTRFCRYLIFQGYETSQITILTMYSAQMRRIYKNLSDYGIYGVRISVVDNFQGEENDIIIMSFVRSNKNGSIGFVAVPNRVNVAMSRAKIGFYGIGNFENMKEKSENLWKPLVQRLKDRNNIGRKLELYCQNHPKMVFKVDCANDFNQVPQGCCPKPCDMKLICGHTCERSCHIDDIDHKKAKCTKKCSLVLCDSNHRCKKQCHFPGSCGPCPEIVKRKKEECGHELKLACSKKTEDVPCSFPCNNELSCGHKCGLKCGETCDVSRCLAKVFVKPKCGHSEIKVACRNKEDEQYLLRNCYEPCKVLLKCGHKCSGCCGQCLQGRLHRVCTEKCDRILLCGHTCKHPCARNCPPCDRKCEHICIHNRCSHQCGTVCSPCKEPCGWQCEHVKCTNLCSEPCNREICMEPCKKKLKCGHPCIGTCGDNCPELCGVCDKAEVQEIFFGYEDAPDAKFVQLSDCKHVFELKGFKRYVNESCNSQIQVVTCPKCKNAIRRSLLFNSQVSKVFADIERVKVKQSGSVDDNLKLSRQLSEKLRQLVSSVKNIEELKAPLRQQALYIVAEQGQNLNGFNLNKQELEKISNVTQIVDEVVVLLLCDYGSGFGVKLFEDRLAQVLRFIKTDFQNNEQQLFDLVRELKTLKAFGRGLIVTQSLTKSKNEEIDSSVEELRQKAFELFSSIGPLSDEKIDRINKFFEVAYTKHSQLGISLEEKTMVLKAMSFGEKGHWYKCPKGHIYCIGDCGGATELGICPECKESIGGVSHRLLDSNAVASEMDGATLGAYESNAIAFNNI